MRRPALPLLSVALLVALALSLAAPALAVPVLAAPERLRVYYAGPAGPVQDALSLSPYVAIVTDVAQAQVIVLNDATLSAQAATPIRDALSGGAGLLLILGPHSSDEMLTALLGVGVSSRQASDAVGLVAERGADSVMESNVIWNSAPQVRERSTLTGVAGSTVLARTYETSEPLLLRTSVGGSVAYVLTAWLSPLANGAQANSQLAEWPYFKYLIYHLAARAAGQTPVAFADYPLSPVPHQSERATLVLVVGLMIGTTVSVFRPRAALQPSPSRIAGQAGRAP